MINFNRNPVYPAPKMPNPPCNATIIQLSVPPSKMRTLHIRDIVEKPSMLENQYDIIDAVAVKMLKFASVSDKAIAEAKEKDGHLFINEKVVTEIDHMGHEGNDLPKYQITERCYVPVLPYGDGELLVFEMIYHAHDKETKTPVHLKGTVPTMEIYHLTSNPYFNIDIYQNTTLYVVGSAISKGLGIPRGDLFYGYAEPCILTRNTIVKEIKFQATREMEGERYEIGGCGYALERFKSKVISFPTNTISPYETNCEYLKRLLNADAEGEIHHLAAIFRKEGPDFVVKINSLFSAGLNTMSEDTREMREMQGVYASAIALWLANTYRYQIEPINLPFHLAAMDTSVRYKGDPDYVPYNRSELESAAESLFVEMNAKMSAIYKQWSPLWHKELLSDDAMDNIWGLFQKSRK